MLYTLKAAEAIHPWCGFKVAMQHSSTSSSIFDDISLDNNLNKATEKSIVLNMCSKISKKESLDKLVKSFKFIQGMINIQ